MNAPSLPKPITANLLTDHLLATGEISMSEFARANAAILGTGEAADVVLNRLGLCSEDTCAAAWGEVLGRPVVNIAALSTGLSSHPMLDGAFLKARAVAPAIAAAGQTTFAMADPSDDNALTAGLFALGARAQPAIATRSDIMTALERTDQATSEAPETTEEHLDQDRLRDLASDAPVVQWVDGLFDMAARQGASDIHLEPVETGMRLRLRIDGDLHEETSPPDQMHAAIVSRIKIMAGLDIAETRLPQDGRIRTAAGGNVMDLRVATAPTPGGETAVIRVLDPSRARIGLGELGLAPAVETGLLSATRKARGLILVSGPTGAGKSTTLYALLDQLVAEERKVISVEDPVEYASPGVAQIQAAPKIGLTFAAALRSVLRHDPDIVMVGEIRDRETAETAIEAALTGHLVLSTVHANSAAATVIRLIDMGVAPYLLASALTAVLAQRLAGRICQCRAEATIKSAECPLCGGRGVHGRIAISELLTVSDEIRKLILAGADERTIEKAAKSTGFAPQQDDLTDRINAGLVDPATATKLGLA